MRIALATCSKVPDWEVDDQPLHAAFRARGIEIEQPVWDDPAVDWSSFDACLIRYTWDYPEKRDAFVAWADRVAGLTPLFNDASTVRWNTHKSYLRDLEERGVPTAPTEWLEAGSSVDLAGLLDDRGWTRGFVKPAIGSTARETMRFSLNAVDGLDDLAPAQAHLDRMLTTEGMLLQPYLASVETTGELSAIVIDGVITHTVRKIPVPGDYRVQDDFGASDGPHEFTADERRLVLDIMDAVEADLLYGRTDFLRDDAGDLRLTELELVEPSFFFRHGPAAAERLVDALLRRV